MNLQQSSLSKNALKKLLKQQKWEESRQERKAAQKEKDKKKKLEKKKAVELGLIPPPIKKPKPNQITSNMRVVIDLSFDSMMTDTEITSVSSQLTRCYSANRSTLHSVNLFFTSYGQRIQNRFDTKIQSHINWKDVVFDTKSYLERFDKDDLVYLTADATDVIDELDENKVYIIGGIVDKNRHKNLCYDKAKKENIATAQLPIEKCIKLTTRKVLTINHVFEILVRWLEYKDWQKAFLDVIPQRKFNEEGKKKRRIKQNVGATDLKSDIPDIMQNSPVKEYEPSE
ncbi:guanine-1-methyltransferase-domain-containing protein [Gigaspora rosea]|uniref:tRNA (guanine(9)-N1)-methyltransferase n=1 Tax=Gigaspora rosea TaxID=44941 RepID=A0A397V857_9GLOM|nr:guanine-1-methyltransferase-domain-containing protein [Gigaspora rosea]CAG8636977.1 4660_t:CDS:2 [Gigaspora rosea]